MIDDDKIQEAFYIKDLILQKEEIIYNFSEENLDNLWTDLAHGLPDVLPTEYDPTYLQLLIGMDNLMRNDDCPEESILTIKEYISDKVDSRLDETIKLLKKRVEIMNKNINNLQTQYKKDWKVTYETTLMNLNDIKNDVGSLNIDEILDKINDSGMSALTKDEKTFLKRSGRGKNNDKDDGSK